MFEKIISNAEQGNLDIAMIREHILQVESLFYKSNRKGEILSYLKLNVESDVYDKKYEQRVRRKELNLLYVLDEALSQANINTHRAIDSLDRFEEYISSADFYRQLIFGNCLLKTQSHIDELTSIIKKNTAILKEAVTDEEYKACIENLSYLRPPKERSSLVSDLNEIANVISFIFK